MTWENFTKILSRWVFQSRNEVFLSIWPLIYKQAIKIGMKFRVEPAELAQVGAESVLRNYWRYDNTHRVKPITYFGTVAIHAMLDAVCTDKVIRLPRNHRIRLFATIREAAAKASKVCHLTVNLCAAEEEPQIDRDEEVAALMEAVDRLPERLRFVVRQRMNDLTRREVGEMIGVGKERIRQLEVEAHDYLRAALTRRVAA